MIHKRKIQHPLKTVLVITVGFLILYMVTKVTWTLYLAAVIGLLGLSSDQLAARIDRFWMKLADLLGLFIPNILLTLVFYFILTPLAWLSKLFGDKDPVKLKRSAKSQFKDCKKEFEKSTFEVPW